MGGTDQIEGVCTAHDLLRVASSVEEGCQRAVEGMGELLAFDVCEFVVTRSDEFVLATRSGVKVTDSADEPVLGQAVSDRAFRSREPLVIGDTTCEESLDAPAEYRSLLAVPVGTYGVLQLAARAPDAFDDRALALADVYAAYVEDVLDEVSEETAESGSRERSTSGTHDHEYEKYRTLVDQFPNGLVTLFDEELRYQLVGGRGLENLDLSTEDLEGNRLHDVFPDENATQLEPLYHEALDGDSNVTELTLEERVFRIHVVPVYDEAGEVIAGIMTSQDVTERTRMEDQLRRHETHLRQAQEVADLGSWSLDIAEDELHWSEGCYRIFGVPSDESISYDRFLEMVHPEDREYVDEQWSAAMEGDSYDIEHRVVVDEETKWVHQRAEIEVDEDGAPQRGIGVVQDVTDQKEREQELDAARRRYRTLLEAAPDPVFVADAESGEVIETNAAAERFRGQPREEIVGLSQTDLHPDDRGEQYRELFETHVVEGGTKRRLPDGSQIHAVTADGEETPVEISVATAELAGRRVILGVFRDVSEQVTYEQTLTDLNEVARDLFGAETSAEVGQLVVEAVTTTLGLTSAAVYLVDEDDGALRPVAYDTPPEILDEIGGLPVFQPGEGIVWRVLSDGESALFDDVRADDDVYNPQTPFRSEIIVPLGDQGVLVVGDTRPAAFDRQSLDLVELLGATTEAALERAEREQRLKDHEQQLRTHSRQLEHLESINSRIREVARSIVQSKARSEIEQSVCAKLVETDSFEFAWIGEVDPVTDSLVPRARAGESHGYLERVSLSLDGESGTEPAVRSAQTHETTVVENAARDITRDDWCRKAVRRDFRSVLSIPLVYEESLQGVLTLYASDRSAFSALSQPVLLELGDLIAHGIVATERKQALLSNRATELDFTIHDQGCFFLRYARATEAEIELTGIIPQSDDTSLVFVEPQSGSTDRLLEEAKLAPEVETARLIDDDDGSLLQLRIAEPFIASRLADHGIALRTVSATSTGCRVTVAVPPTLDVNRVMRVVSNLYPESELLAKRERSEYRESAGPFVDRVIDRLTARQLEVAETAYLSGYFESPRRMNGGELAEKLDISASAFHHHIRESERKVFELVFEHETTVSRSVSSDSGPG